MSDKKPVGGEEVTKFLIDQGYDIEIEEHILQKDFGVPILGIQKDLGPEFIVARKVS